MQYPGLKTLAYCTRNLWKGQAVNDFLIAWRRTLYVGMDPPEPVALAGLDEKIYGAGRITNGALKRLKLQYGDLRPVFTPWKPPTSLTGAVLTCKLDIAKQLVGNAAKNEAVAVQGFVMGTVLFVCVRPSSVAAHQPRPSPITASSFNPIPTPRPGCQSRSPT